MLKGIVLILLALACYAINILLIRYFINKKVPGLLEMDLRLPSPSKDKEYLWEKTAGSGIVPKWVSAIGLIAIPLFVTGVLFFVTALF